MKYSNIQDLKFENINNISTLSIATGIIVITIFYIYHQI